MQTLLGVSRLLFFAVYTMIRVGQIIVVSLVKGYRPDYSLRVRRHLTRRLLRVLGVRLRVEGVLPDYPCIMMGNHRSYLDPALIVHDVLAYPVSKAEVTKWPIVGYGAKVTGTIFLQRESAGSRKRTLESIDQTVKSGFAVILFPEGTTHSTELSGPFRPGAFKLAANGAYPVVPVAIEYASPDDYWVGDDNFVGHFIRRFGRLRMPVCLRYGPPLTDTDADQLLTDTQNWIDAQLPELKRMAVAMLEK